MLIDILQSFLPWILYFLIKGHTQLSIDVAVIVAGLTSIFLELNSLKKGFVLSWGTLIYFIFLTIFVVIFKNQWILKHEWIFSTGTLALICWTSILLRKPFTMQYAKEKVEKDKWNHPLFLKINYILSALWGFIFLFHLTIHFIQIYIFSMNDLIANILSYVSTIFAIWVTTWFPDWYKQKYINHYGHKG